MNKGLFCILFFLSVSTILTGASYAQEGGSSFPMTVTDSADRTVTIPMSVERIIVLNTDAAEAVTILGAGDKIVGVVDMVTKRSYYFPQIKDVTVVGTWREFDYEKIAEIARAGGDSIRPDILVIGYPTGSYKGTSYAVDAVAKGLEPFGIPVVGFDFYKEDEVSEELAKLGAILGREEEAEEYLSWRDGVNSEVRAAVRGKDVSRVYFEYSSKGPGELKTNGEASEINDIISRAGGANVAGELSEESATVDWEWVIGQAPEVIIRTKSDDVLGWGAYPSADTIQASSLKGEITDREGARAVPAVEDGRVYIVFRDMLYGMDSAVGLTYLAKIFHPEANLDPVAVHKEYLDQIGVKYPEDSTYVFPEIS